MQLPKVLENKKLVVESMFKLLLIQDESINIMAGVLVLVAEEQPDLNFM